MIGHTRALTGDHVHIDCHALGLGKGGFPEHTPFSKTPRELLYIDNKICRTPFDSVFHSTLVSISFLFPFDSLINSIVKP